MKARARLLGTPRFSFGGATYEPSPTKATALLCYLASEGGWCSRSRLAFIFYPDIAEDAARQNLRQILASIRRLPYGSGLVSEPSRLRWPVDTDVQDLERAVREEDVASAGELMGGRLLEGLMAVDAPGFQAWLTQQRDELQGRWRDLVLRRAADLEPGIALGALRTVLKHDALDEEALQAYLSLSERSGHRTAALRAYRAFEHNLDAELGLRPAPATRCLADRIESAVGEAAGVPVRMGDDAGTRTPASLSAAVPPITHVGNAFVGRAGEMEAIGRLLSGPDCRMLTLLAGGGTGKTRLALEVARRLTDGFPGGACFVALDALSGPEGILATVAAALGVELGDHVQPVRQVAAAIGDRRMLMVLDNYEHLLAGAGVCSDLLRNCENLKLIVTSRERLNLLEEWVLRLDGLALPDASSDTVTGDGPGADAVTLFLERAKQARLGFEPDDADLAAITELCRLVEGLPLAIEIAATWVRAMPCPDIAAAFRAGGADITSLTRNLPDRHRTLRATLEHSWSLLSQGERVALGRLAVFAGGFRAEAAAVVAGVGVDVLATLLDKSLLRLDARGRYDMHGLVYRFCQGKLAEQAAERAAAEEAHGLYFLGLLRGERGEEAATAYGEFAEEDLANLAAAWRWAVHARRVVDVEGSVWTLGRAFWRRPAEVRTLLAEAIATLDADDPSHAVALAHLSIALADVHRLLFGVDAMHDSLIGRGLELSRRLGSRGGLLRGLAVLGKTKYLRGALEEARDLYVEGLELARAGGERRELERYWHLLLQVEAELQDVGGFRRVCYAVAGELHRDGDAIARASVGLMLGEYLVDNGFVEEGDASFDEALRESTASGGPRSIGTRFLALRAIRRGELAQARELAEEFHDFVRSVGSPLGESHALIVLGKLAIAEGDFGEAERRLLGALEIGWRADFGRPLHVLIAFARLRLAEGRPAEAAHLLGLVRAQRTYRRSHSYEADKLIAGLEGVLPAAEVAEGLERGRRSALAATVEALLEGRVAA